MIRPTINTPSSSINFIFNTSQSNFNIKNLTVGLWDPAKKRKLKLNSWKIKPSYLNFNLICHKHTCSSTNLNPHGLFDSTLSPKSFEIYLINPNLNFSFNNQKIDDRSRLSFGKNNIVQWSLLQWRTCCVIERLYLLATFVHRSLN